MQAFPTIAALRAELAVMRESEKRIAFVPTMGALHEGHLALVDRARDVADAVVMSIFVNPLQFSAGEDFGSYPRDLSADSAAAEDRGVDLLFAPDASEMYPAEQRIMVSSGALGEAWEGEVRPGHFDGVLTVVAKLFNIVEPAAAVFGEKDLQQLAVVRAMVRDLAFPVEIIGVPTVRDSDGLAISSRNRYLGPAERARALSLPRALKEMRRLFESGERRAEALEQAGKSVIASAADVSCDYLAVVDAETFQRVEQATPGCAAIGAVRVGATRLIDNHIF